MNSGTNHLPTGTGLQYWSHSLCLFDWTSILLQPVKQVVFPSNRQRCCTVGGVDIFCLIPHQGLRPCSFMSERHGLLIEPTLAGALQLSVGRTIIEQPVHRLRVLQGRLFQLSGAISCLKMCVWGLTIAALSFKGDFTPRTSLTTWRRTGRRFLGLVPVLGRTSHTWLACCWPSSWARLVEFGQFQKAKFAGLSAAEAVSFVGDEVDVSSARCSNPPEQWHVQYALGEL